MMKDVRPAKYFFLKVWRWAVSFKGLWFRILICWGLGVIVASLDKPNQFDHRFELRALQPIDSSIVLLLISQSDWTDLHLLKRGFVAGSDTFFWNPELWQTLLQKLAQDQPRAIGVTLFFEPDLPCRLDTKRALRDFNQNIFWAAIEDSVGRPLLPIFANVHGNNTGLSEIPLDEDRHVRRFSSPSFPIPHLTYRLAEVLRSRDAPPSIIGNESKLINFRGPSGTFPTIGLKQFLSAQFPVGYFTNKVIIIGAKDSENHVFQTAMGEMTRAEIYANALDNLIHQRWVSPAPQGIEWMIIFVLVSITAFLLFQYPQVVSLTVIVGVLLGVFAMSFWLFDRFYIWLPLYGEVGAVLFTYVVFVSYQLTLKENLTWRFEQERKNFFELETMKSNFVSLISHDLKTPIAKIQAICDRLISHLDAATAIQSIKLIRKESMELHRYIQSILHISRVESKTMKLQTDAVDINHIIEAVAEALKPLASEKEIEIVLQLQPLFSIEADAGLIREVILNIVENAIKYSLNKTAIVIKSEENVDVVQVAVTDHGPGVAKDEQSRIFEKFYRGREHALKTKGTGLGLYLVKYFIELHGGRVFIDSQKGSGTTVGFSLPLEAGKGA